MHCKNDASRGNRPYIHDAIRMGFICSCGVYVFVRAVTIFASSISFRGKNSASAVPPQLSPLHICDPAGVGITAMWRSRIADRYNAPRSVSRVRAGFRDDCVGGVCGKKLPQCCLPLLALRSLKTLRALSLGKNKRAVLCVWRILPLHLLFC